MPGVFLLPGAGVARAVRAQHARPRLDGGALPVPTQCPAALRSRPVKKGGKPTAESDSLKRLTAPTPLRQAYLLCGLLFTRSLVALAREAEAVGQFRVEARAPVPSILREVDTLARATEQMKASLRSFGKYVPADLVRQLHASGVEARLGGTSRVLAVFFCDLADFTAFSESLPPQQVVEQLSEYFDAFTEEVAATGGTVDKFIGDAIMAFWSAPDERPDHARAACRCALNCQRRLAELRATWKEQGKALLFARIGINTGPVVVGNIGSARRFNYTVIGDAVNVASRLEGPNKFYGTRILISEETYRMANDAVSVRQVDRVSMKGKSASILVYELLGLKE
jgi:adenylate cyclase